MAAAMPGVAEQTTERTKKLVFNCPAELADQVVALAQRGRRPLTTQLIMLLEEALEQRAKDAAA